MDKNTQNYLIVGAIVAIVIVAALLFFFYSGNDDNTPPATNTTPNTPSNTSNTSNTSNATNETANTTNSTGAGLSSLPPIVVTPSLGGGGSTSSKVSPVGYWKINDADISVTYGEEGSEDLDEGDYTDQYMWIDYDGTCYMEIEAFGISMDSDGTWNYTGSDSYEFYMEDFNATARATMDSEGNLVFVSGIHFENSTDTDYGVIEGTISTLVLEETLYNEWYLNELEATVTVDEEPRDITDSDVGFDIDILESTFDIDINTDFGSATYAGDWRVDKSTRNAGDYIFIAEDGIEQKAKLNSSDIHCIEIVTPYEFEIEEGYFIKVNKCILSWAT
ncbi:hypothetical protein [Methanolapillus ohkumae]|uniref:Uncharacterized protein n=1 Tax=Methanolapillus ohkumae TaxID=3028298 RepID=A0AA97A6R7_9EURY|nr:hypothetical protein MsAm2_13800 [Methanosarcinaceae archaeon Am2]